MDIRNRKSKIFALALSLAAAMLLGLSGCDDNPVDDPDDDHFEAAGLVLVQTGSQVVNVDSNRVEGSLSVRVDSLSPEITLTFIDEDGESGYPEGDEFEVFVRSGDTSIARIEDASLSTHAGKLTHGGHDGSFKVRGVKAGSTVIEIGILHGGHPDFTAPDISITVTD